MEFSFGTDPEFILKDARGRLKSAIGVVPGTRSRRMASGGCEFFYDNVLAECAIPPAVTRDEAVRNVRSALHMYSEIVKPFRMTTEACGEFPAEELRHRDARSSGCDREYCAYSLRMVPDARVKSAMRRGGFRTAGGHVHIGTRMGSSHEDSVMLVRMLDLVLGLASIVMDSSSGARERRRLYGSAGRYRQPAHGVEYRTMGNFWLASPRLVGIVFDICGACVGLCERGFHRELWRVDRDRLESDDFWNFGGDPAECHECVGYDAELVRSMFEMEKKDAMEAGGGVLQFAMSLLPSETRDAVFEAGDAEYEMYEEWGLSTSS
jgi:hypothetical protein